MDTVSRYKIFIVDDSIFVRNSLMSLLPELGFEVVGMAETAKNAFRYVADTRPDVVLLDVSLPSISAEDVIRGLLAINPNLEIILLAPLSNQGEISKLMKFGARDFIPKPLIPRQVEYVLRGYEFASGTTTTKQTQIQQIAEIHSLFYNECLKHAPEREYSLIYKAIHDPLKRIRRKYSDRYKITFNPIKIDPIQAHETHTRDTFNMYKVQLDRLYYSIARRLNKEFPLEYVSSFLSEVYQTFYPLAIYLMESTSYRLPEWENINLEFYDPTYHHGKSIPQAYERGLGLLLPEVPTFDISEHIQPYRTFINHDPRLAPKFPKPQIIDVEKVDLFVIMSHFDDIMGPTADTIIPPPQGRLQREQLQSIPRLMDMIGAKIGETFIHSSNNYGSVNLIFSVPLEVRGGIRDYMLSIVVHPAEVEILVKISQTASVIRAVTAEITNFYRENPELAKSDLKLSNEPENLLSEFLEEVRVHLKAY